jgi:hypothetical protein
MMLCLIGSFYKIIAKNIVFEVMVDIESFTRRQYYRDNLKLFMDMKKTIIGILLFQYLTLIHPYSKILIIISSVNC